MIIVDETDDMVDVANDIEDEIDDKDKLVELITELYFLLEVPERIRLKKNIS